MSILVLQVSNNFSKNVILKGVEIMKIVNFEGLQATGSENI